MKKNADEVLQKLLQGNERFVREKMLHPNQDLTQRAAISNGQHPFAVVVACSDSRVCPEIIFDVGLGDLFVIRTAGNVSDEIVAGSISYAIEHLGVPLIVVVGHQNCGAVSAAATRQMPDGPIADVVKAVMPAVDVAENLPGDKIENIVKANAKLVAAGIDKSLFKVCAEKNLDVKIVSAYYSLDTGKVEIV